MIDILQRLPCFRGRAVLKLKKYRHSKRAAADCSPWWYLCDSNKMEE